MPERSAHHRPARTSPAAARLSLIGTTVVLVALCAVLHAAIGSGRPTAADAATTTTKRATTTSTRARTTTTVARSSSTDRSSSPSSSTTYATTTHATSAPTTVTPSTAPVPLETGDVPFPAPLVAPIASAPGEPADVALRALYPLAGSDASVPQVVVQFRAPFDLPGTGYRVSVFVGDPTGPRLQASLRSTGGTDPVGEVRNFDGSTWRDGGSIPVAFQPGYAIVTVPTGSAPAGGTVWVVVERAGNQGARTSPFFSRDSLFGDGAPGELAAGSHARIDSADGTLLPAVTVVPAAPVVRVRSGVISVTTSGDAPPTLVGQRVARFYDTVFIAPNFANGAALADVARIDLSARTITLEDLSQGLPVDRTGDHAWVTQGFGDGGRLPEKFELDLSKIATALGVPLDPASIGVGIGRTAVLADGRYLTVDPVLGTSAWFDQAPLVRPPAAGPAAAPASGGTDEDLRRRGIVGATVVLVLVLLGGWRVHRRRRARRFPNRYPSGGPALDPAADRVPWLAEDGRVTSTAEHEHLARITGTVAAVRLDDPPRGPDPVVARSVPAVQVLERPRLERPRGDETQRPVETRPPVPPVRAGVDPLAALAALDADLATFRQRLSTTSVDGHD